MPVPDGGDDSRVNGRLDRGSACSGARPAGAAAVQSRYSART